MNCQFYARASLLFLILQLVHVSASYADNANVVKNAANSKPLTEKDKRPTWKYKRDANEFKSNKMQQIPNISGIPPYKGGNVQFAHGEEFPNAKGGTAITYTFTTSDSYKKVWEFYKEALVSASWTINTQSGSQSATPGPYLFAKLNNNICNVTIQPVNKTRLSVRVFYRQAS